MGQIRTNIWLDMKYTNSNKLEEFIHDYKNTLTIQNTYRGRCDWQYGHEMKIEFLYTQNLFCCSDIYGYNLPCIAVNPKAKNDSFYKKEFEVFLYKRIVELCNPNGVESSSDFFYYNQKGRAIIWDEYGIEIDNMKLSPITIDDIKSFNIIRGDTTYNKDFINYLKKNRNINLYITENINCRNQDYIAEFIRIRDNIEIISKKEGRLHENKTLAESLSEHDLYDCLSANYLLEGTLYREICRYVDFKGIEISNLPETGYDLYHKIKTKKDEQEKVWDNYEWYLHIEGGNILNNRIKEVLNENNENIEKEDLRIEKEAKRKEEEARRAKFKYNQRNWNQRDSSISFDEATHQYKVNGEILQSVTNFVKNSFPQFDAEVHAKYQAAKMRKTIKEVLDMWETQGKESRELGTALHKKIEGYYQGNILNDDDESFKLFKMFADKIKLEPYRTEWSVYDWEHKIAGTIDFVDYQDGKYIIYDWKRSDKLINNEMPVKINIYNEKGKYPLEHLDNSPYYHYALQLSIYKYILEKNYNIKVSGLRLGIFHPTYKKPYVIRIPYLEKEINDIFNLRSEVIF